MSDHVCVIDRRTPIEDPYACDPCMTQLDGWLRDIAEWWPRLPEHLQPGRGGGVKVGGSRQAPLPFSGHVFDLLTPFPFNRDSAHNVLTTAVRDWCETFAGVCTPPPDVAGMTGWLRARLGDAQRKHPALDECHTDIRTLHGAIRNVVGETAPKPEPCPQVPCKSVECDRKTLMKLNDGSGYVKCLSCGRMITEAEYEAWVKLIWAYAKKEMAAA